MCFYLVLTWLWQKEKSLKRRFSLNYTTPSGSVVKNSPAIQETGDMGLIPGKIPWRRAWQPTPVFLPGKSHGQRSLAGCSPWGRKESNTAEATEHARVVHRSVHTRTRAHTHTHTHTHTTPQEVPFVPATTHSHSTQSPRRPHSHRPVYSSLPVPSPIICLQTAVQTQISKSPGHACFSPGPGLKIPALRLLSNRPQNMTPPKRKLKPSSEKHYL